VRAQAERVRAALYVILVGIVLSLIAPGPASALTRNDWPQFMSGATHQSWNRAETAITPATAPGLRQVWAKELDVSGYLPSSGSPVIVGSSVVVGGGTVTARAVADGRLLWKRRLRGVVVTTPAWSGSTIVVTEMARTTGDTRFTGVAALEAGTGAVRWQRRIADAGLSSPTIVGRSVLVSDNTGVTRLSLRNGRVIWRAPLPQGPVSAPASDGLRVYVNHHGGGKVTALDLSTGASIWSVGDEGGSFTTDGFAPTLANGLLYAPQAGRGVAALDPATGAQRWRAEDGETFWWGLATDRDHLIGSSNDTHVFALNARTGKRLWTRDLGGIARTAALAGGVALFADQSADGANQVDLLDLRTGAVLGAVAVPPVANGDLSYSPMPVAVSNGRVAVADWDHLAMLALP
jgi:hypothetical protein